MKTPTCPLGHHISAACAWCECDGVTHFLWSHYCEGKVWVACPRNGRVVSADTLNEAVAELGGTFG